MKIISNRQEGFQMCILRISWVVTNEEILGSMRTEKKILNRTKIRSLQYLGHGIVAEHYAEKDTVDEPHILIK